MTDAMEFADEAEPARTYRGNASIVVPIDPLIAVLAELVKIILEEEARATEPTA